jgi:hypothetical protein
MTVVISWHQHPGYVHFPYCDPDGIALSDEKAAIAYAERIIRELKADEGYDAPDLQMYVKDESQRRIVTIPFNPTEVRTLERSHAVMPMGITWNRARKCSKTPAHSSDKSRTR